jgi:hypothetical protein
LTVSSGYLLHQIIATVVTELYSTVSTDNHHIINISDAFQQLLVTFSSAFKLYRPFFSTLWFLSVIAHRTSKPFFFSSVTIHFGLSPYIFNYRLFLRYPACFHTAPAVTTSLCQSPTPVFLLPPPVFCYQGLFSPTFINH